MLVSNTVIYRFPCVALKIQTGGIVVSRCTCEIRLDGRCAHVAALLYLIEEVSLGRPAIVAKACTSKPQSWGQGAKSKKNPKPVHHENYGKKKNLDPFINVDVRPEHLRHTTTEELNSFLVAQQSFPKKTMWLDISIKYSDYDVTNERKIVLFKLQNMSKPN